MAASKSWSTSYDKKLRTDDIIVLVNGNVQEKASEITFSYGTDWLGGNNPNWRYQVKHGLQAATQLSVTESRYDIKAGDVEEYFHWTGPVPGNYGRSFRRVGDHFNYGLSPSMATDSLIHLAKNRAKAKYISQCNDARRIINSGELVGELRELIRQVKSPGKSLRKGISSYLGTVKKRALGKKIRRLPAHRRSDVQAKIIADTWLEYRFGWAPLIGELDAAQEYVREKDPAQRLQQRKVRAHHIEKDHVISNPTWFQITDGLPGYEARVHQSVQVIAVYRGLMRMSNSAGGYVSEKVGFAPSDWIPTAWELLPYSFLIDYFANFGEIINALAFPSNQLRWTVETVLTEQAAWFEVRPKWRFGLTGSISPGIDYTVERIERQRFAARRSIRTVFRNPYYGDLVPDFRVSIPGSGIQWTNIGALVTNAKQIQKLLRP